MDEKLSLKEGLIDFQKRNAKYFSKEPHSFEGNEFLKCHDITHLVFGCDTSLYGEGLVKIWSSFGTTESFLKITKGYHSAKAFHLVREYSYKHVLKNIFRLVRSIPRVLLRVHQMSKPWPFKSYHDYLDVPIYQIRKEFNIKVLN